LQLRYERHVGVERPPLRWVYREELRRIRRYETHVASAFDHLTVVSEVDRRYLPSRNVTVVPLGVDADVFRPLPALRRPAPTVVFSGRLGYAPNADAAVWLVEEILPRIHAARPDVQLVLAGADPSAPVRALARRPGVVLTGRVSSMPHALNVATVAVAPLRSGSGMQNKVLEAMACALPVVTTHRAFEGIQGQPGRDLIVADSPTQIADAVVALLADPARAESIGQAARETVRRHHSWEASAARLEEIWQAVASGANE
jgi:glycosyltransferase involved in cell wall biosynthesis